MSGEEVRRRRLQRQWTQAQLAREMRRVSVRSLPAMDSLLRQIKRWEAGEVHPSHDYQELLAETFERGLVLDQELFERLSRSDLGSAQVAELRGAIDGIGVSYTTTEPEVLLQETLAWMARFDQARTGRLSLAQTAELVELTGWAALLAGNLAYDLGDQETASRAQRLGLSTGQEAGVARLSAWAHELAAWRMLGAGRMGFAIERSRAGQLHAGRTDIGAHLVRHEAEALANLGEATEALRALERAAAITDELPPPSTPNHHFQKDKDQQEKVEMTVLLSLGETDRASDLADAVERSSTAADGQLLRPMRVAKARAVQATAAARRGDLDKATAIGESIFEIKRHGIPEILRNTRELADSLAGHAPAEHFLTVRAELGSSPGEGG